MQSVGGVHESSARRRDSDSDVHDADADEAQQDGQGGKEQQLRLQGIRSVLGAARLSRWFYAWGNIVMGDNQP
eukprot:COSAG05_NODE_4_length_49189_cov_157.128784_28_plen_73_part_00